MTEYKKPLPFIGRGNEPYWEAAKKHELHIQKCHKCGKYVFYPRGHCPQCFSSDMEWVKVSGKGKIYTYTICQRPAGPAFSKDVPYNIAMVDLDEGPRMMTNIVGCRNEDIKIGMPVEVVFEDVTGTVSLPKFKPLT
jgi:uncharacterized OB-fold protein